MAVNLENLELRVGDVALSYTLTGGANATMAWECFHDTLGDVLYRGSVRRSSPTIPGIETLCTELIREANSQYISYIERHRAIPAISDYSAHDAALILDDWFFYRQSDNTYLLSHPVCGDHAVSNVVQGSVVSMVNAILSQVLPPPTWAWAESVNPGELRVKCVAVPGASLYAVLDGNSLLQTVPDADWTTITVDPGTYNIRIAPVVGGNAGIPSFYIPIEVEAVAVPVAASVPEELADVESPSLLNRFLTWMSD